jgi:hypothetical protein
MAVMNNIQTLFQAQKKKDDELAVLVMGQYYSSHQ